ncbi:glycosyltransferase [Saccharibacter sp. 17.LH.SD]|uniref:glycosyltransferase family 2 protein n=1 Tax=Saccharibacter sp. 17.LH.SD TaxID=2689393 RepID=UPI0013721FBA|nr:glycosyltransferase [Saccharibacter sp. 17.LH.SD]
MAIKLGIGIITYNRKEILRQCVEHIRAFTQHSFELVVADDGSQDGTPALLERLNVPYITGDNRGIAWNRNRALWWLKEEKKCDVILVFEDDCRPCEFGWERPWIKAVEAYGHMNHMPEITLEIDNDVSSGSGTAEDPYIAPMHQAFCVGYHARALDYVGYLDVRFEKYGEEHVEHTHRFLRAGYGGLPQFRTPERGQVFFLRGGLEALPSETHGTPDCVSRNIIVHRQIQGDPFYRAPWRSDEQLFLFREEMEAARNRPQSITQPKDNGFDVIISLGGDEKTNFFIKRIFGRADSSFFDGFVTPFHSLIHLFETDFQGLFSTACLYGYWDALRCRDSLLVYHNCLDIPEGEHTSVELFHSQLGRLKQEYADHLAKLDVLCDGTHRVLFVRDWHDALHYEGTHRPSHALTPDFRRLVAALEARYPSLEFRVLFTNFGSASVADSRMIFANLSVPDVCDDERKVDAWGRMVSQLGIYRRGDEAWDDEEVA